MYNQGVELLKDVVGYSSSVDALTVTTSDGATRSRIGSYLEAVEARGRDLGIRPKPANVHGFKGWRVGSVQWGVKDGREMVMVTGKFAEEAMVMVDPNFVDVTRVDTQVTVQFAQPNLGVVRAMAAYLESGKAGKMGKKPWRLLNSLTGDTLYLGSRESDRFFRVYDKGGQEGGQKGLRWRYELECKGSAAERDYAALVRSESLQRGAAELVYHHFGKKRCKVPISVQDPPIAVEIPRKETSREEYLTWLSKSVKPVVLHLQSMGERDRMVEALGIQLELFHAQGMED